MNEKEYLEYTKAFIDETGLIPALEIASRILGAGIAVQNKNGTSAECRQLIDDFVKHAQKTAELWDVIEADDKKI